MKKSSLAAFGPARDQLPIILAIVLGIAVLGAPKMAAAQLAPAAPVRENIDANGVDLFTLKMTLTGPALVLGSQGNALSYYRWNKGSGWTDNVMGFMNQSGTIMTVSLGGVSDSFSVSGSTYTSTEANGSTLTYNSTTKIYTYTRGDGAVARFDKNSLNEYVAFSNNGMLLDIVSPDGEKLSFAYANITYCAQVSANGVCQRTAKAYRVSSVTSNYGYRLLPQYSSYDFFYDPTDPYSQPDFVTWAEVLGVNAQNLAISSSTVIASQSFGYVVNAGVTSYAITDAVGRQTKYRMSAGVVAGITFPSHSSEDVTIGYSGSDVSTVTRVGAGTTTYSKSDVGNVRTVTVAAPAVTPAISTATYIFDIAKQRMTSVTVNDGSGNRITAFEYDTNGRLTKTTMPEGNYVQLTRDARGNVTETRAVAKSGSGLLDVVTTANFDTTCTSPAKCNQPNWTKDAKNNETDYTYDPTSGAVLTVTLPADSAGTRPQTRYGYTSLQAYYYNSGGSIVASGLPVYRLTSTSACRTMTSCTALADERKTTIDYGPQTSGVGNNLQVVGVQTSSGDGSLSATTTTGYDAMGNVTTVNGPLSGIVDQTMAAYNAARQPLWQIGPDPDGAGPALYPAVNYVYRPDGQVDYIQSGTVTAQSQSGMSSFVESQRQMAVYDANGRLIRQKLRNGNTDYQVTDQVYDAAGRVLCSMVRMDPNNWSSTPSSCSPPQAADRVTYNTYDALSRVSMVTTGYGTTDVANEKTATFTANGRLQTLKDAENNKTTYEYDGHDRLVKTSFPDTTKGAGTSSSTDYEQVTYDANGNVATFRTRRNETIQLTYDNLNRLVTKVMPSRVGLDFTYRRNVYYGYDLLGDMTYARFDSASGEGITNAFNVLGQQTSTSDNMDGVSRTVSYEYDVAGNLTKITHPDGQFFTYNRNSAGGLDQIKQGTSNPLLRPVLDSSGRLNRIDRYRTSPGDWAASSTYAYDSISRLASLATDVNGTSFDATTSLSYNPANQITSAARDNDAYAWSGQVNSDKAYTPDGLNRYGAVAGTSFSFDENANLVADGTYAYIYDEENRLVVRTGGTTVALRYDPLGRLHEIVDGSTTRRFTYDGSDLVAEYDGTGNQTKRYVHGLSGGDDPQVWFEGSSASPSARRDLYADERGSIVAVTDSSGAELYLNTYDEFGVPGSSNSGAFQYTGQVWLPELGMYYYKARMYSPILGRFMQTDPIGYGAGMNMYSYVRNDPMNLLDPSGLADTKPCIGEGALCAPPKPAPVSQPEAPIPYVLVTGYRPPSCDADCQQRADARFQADAAAAIVDQLANHSMLDQILSGAVSRGQVAAKPQAKPNACSNTTLSAASVTAQDQIATAQGFIAVGKAIGNTGPTPTPLSDFIGGMYGYYEAVHTGGPNDIKSQPGPGYYSQTSIAAGNISFGVTCPYGAGFCQFAAGAAQTLGGHPDLRGSLLTGFDTPSDNAGIRVGQAMRAAGCHE